jgi:hypothetical protein
MQDWRSDYQAMLGPMFFGTTPTFDDLMATIGEFESEFNATASGMAEPVRPSKASQRISL